MAAKHKHSCSLDILDIQPDTPAEAWAALWGAEEVSRDTEAEDLWAVLTPADER
ncbi:hypothetical protein [Microbacterium stercoris]|uniref:Uncharacterized protein n=1 Tax=Microbacterium stercoris TaxID=2820289 RepID=A0A939QP48_9MICO|nr:hypothetical protein [Microbacterium stercoris]MBO3664210.1 hypothetical protein [Microbacterium stercoris]